jgi:non-homologous end joining protein Ku
VKIGKEEHLIGADALEQVSESLDREQLNVGVFLSEMPKGASDRVQGVMYAFPVDKKEAQYKELAELLKGRVAVAKGVVRNNELQMLLTVGDDGVIRFTQLVEESQRYPFSPQEIAQKLEKASLNPQVIAVEQKILDKKTADSYDVTEFRDSRLAREEKVIEEYVLNGTVPEIVKEVRQAEEQDELARLQALAN